MTNTPTDDEIIARVREAAEALDEAARAPLSAVSDLGSHRARKGRGLWLGGAVAAAAAVVALVLVVSGSDPQRVQLADEPTQSTNTTTSTTAPPAGIERIDFNNFTYDLGDAGFGLPAGQRATVANGVFSESTDAGSTYVSVERVVLGDFDHNPATGKEAAIWLEVNGGGSATFANVLVYRVEGDKAVLAARGEVGDRGNGGVVALESRGDNLVVTRNSHPQGDCCSDEVTEFTQRLDRDTLIDAAAPVVMPIFSGGARVEFKAGQSSARIEGDAMATSRVTVSLRAGQRLTVSTGVLRRDDLPWHVWIEGPSLGKLAPVGPEETTSYVAGADEVVTVVATAASDASTSTTPDGPTQGSYFGAKLTVSDK